MRDEESRSRGQSLGGPAGGDPPVLNDAYRGSSASSAAAELQRQMNAQLMRMSAMSSFHGDNPFTGTPATPCTFLLAFRPSTDLDSIHLPSLQGSVTQSALEDAFLDMAGSRLDASRSGSSSGSKRRAGSSHSSPALTSVCC